MTSKGKYDERKEERISMLPLEEEHERQPEVKPLMSRRAMLGTGLGLIVLGGIGTGTWLGTQGIATYAKDNGNGNGNKTDNAVIQWNSAALQAIGATATGPTVGSRALAIAHTCMYDAWSVYDSVAVATRPSNIPRQKNKWKDVTASVSYAAYSALVDLFPSQVATFNAVMSNLGYDPNDKSTDINTPSGIGNVAAQAVLSYRHGDGSNQLGDLHTGAYSDYTSYTPVNTPDQIVDPNHWQPLRVSDGNGGFVVQKFLTPHWSKVVPFALTSASQFRPAGPAQASSAAFSAQTDAVLQLSANLNDTSKATAEYWADGPRSSTPPGHWDLLSQFVSAQYLSRKNKHDLSADIKLFFALTNAILDAGIACWECKRYYDSARPVTAVHYLYMGKQISAWGGPGKGTMAMDGGTWKSYIATPGFAEYVSGHSTFSGAGSYILAQAIGNDTFGDSYTAAVGSSKIEPGITPASSVTLSWPTYTAAAIEAGMSRRYGGIHFQQADEDGRALGHQVATQAWTRAQAYINGAR